MSDRDALLRAVLAAPDDDLPRLVFADWLDEHGDAAKASFIREQIAHLRPPHSARAGDAILTWERGFVARVSMSPADFLEHARSLFAANPVERVELSTASVVKAAAGFVIFFPAAVNPGDALARLKGLMNPADLAAWNRPHPSADAARDAISEALVALGRRLVVTTPPR